MRAMVGNTFESKEYKGDVSGVTMMTLFGEYLSEADTVIVHVPYLNSEFSFDNYFDFLEVAYERGVLRVLTRTVRKEAVGWQQQLQEIEEAFRGYSSEADQEPARKPWGSRRKMIRSPIQTHKELIMNR